MSAGYLYPQFYHFECPRTQEIVNSVGAKAVAEEVHMVASLLWFHFHDRFVEECPNTLSCADILALAARDSTVLARGPNWEVPLGRRDSRKANLSVSNNDIPVPNETFTTVLNKFN
ncbi:hypothetical protein CRG98_042731 [Punica granatum]|uniref:peroxidase n=1 Tax=Punica granatum TaxID=22663 RepID=A0A2I0HYW1_PUNGR|nr:hypothetical protein CRG98_042731 [Punica granatum]